MGYLYSQGSACFFHTDLHGVDIPADAVEITDEDHAALIAGQSQGQIIVADAGGFPMLADPPPPEPIQPTVVTMRQARLALLGAGLLTQVNDAIAGMPGTEGEAARIEWEYAATVQRESPLVAGLSTALSLTSSQLDALFVAAAAL